jgi:hypothetical protein
MWPPEVSDQPRSVAQSRDATKFGNVFPFGFSDWTFLERLIDGLVSHVAPRGGARRRCRPCREQDAIKREAEPACKGAERVYLRVAARRNADDAERASCVARKGRPVASALVGERMITKKGIVRHRPGSRKPASTSKLGDQPDYHLT